MPEIYVYSPSGAVRDKAGFRRGMRYLEKQGHRITVDLDALTSHLRFAGDDATRLQALQRAASSPADVTLITRGGYGLTRLLPHIDYPAIHQSIQRGTRWVGFSDFTALQAALYARTGAISYAGPSLIADFGIDPAKRSEGVDDIMAACFDDVLRQQDEGTGWRLRKEERTRYGPLCLEGEVAQPCRLWGGNLSVLTGLIGTPYLPAIEGGILWFEDTGEAPYKIERNLTQWLHAGLLERQRALVLGAFTDSPRYAHDRGFSLQTVVQHLREVLRIPVLTGLPFGHIPTKVMLPFGAPTTLMIQGSEALLLWSAL